MEKILSKIQKLLRLAADSPDSPESQLAGERAAEMMAKHNIGLEDVEKDGTLKDENIMTSDVDVSVKHHQIWEAGLAEVLCDVFDCKRVIVRTGARERVRQFIGTKSDVAILVNFFKYLRLRIAKQAENDFRLQKDQKMFGLGVIDSLTPRLREMYKKKEEVMPSDSRALVVGKQLAVQDYFNRKFPKLGRTTVSMGNGSRQAFTSGVTAGQTMSINQQVGG